MAGKKKTTGTSKKASAAKTAVRKTVKAKTSTASTAASAKPSPKTSTKTSSTTTGVHALFGVPEFKEMEKIMTQQPFQFDKMAQTAANQSREGFEAFVKSGTIFAKGFEDMMKAAASISQTAAEKQAEFAKQLMGSKTLNEFTEAQNKIAQANFDQFMAGATKLSEMGVKVLSEASEPLNAQMTKAMQTANKTMAA